MLGLVVAAIAGGTLWYSRRQQRAGLEQRDERKVTHREPVPAPVPVVPAPKPKPARPDAGVRNPRAQIDPKDIFSVPVDRASDPVDGSDSALVTLVEFGEFACPFCERAHHTLAELRVIFGPKLRIVWKNLVVHPQKATIAAHAACAARLQNQFFEYQDALWKAAFHPTGGVQRLAALEPDALDDLAQSLGLDRAQFKADREGAACEADFQDDKALAERLGVNATPSFYINGRHLSGAQPVASFEALIREELANAERAVQAGIAPDQVYPSIVASGKQSP